MTSRARPIAAAILLGGCALLPPSHFGDCRYDRERMIFAVGDEAAQARCLLRPVRKAGVLAQETALPAFLAFHVGRTDVPKVAALRAWIVSHETDPAWKTVADNLDQPMARAWDNRSDAPSVRYFVIHDTSTPWFGSDPFPKDLEHDRATNDLSQFFHKDPVAHFFVNRRGDIAQGHDFAVPWRATKRETRAPDNRAKGLFVHIELVQPRRGERGHGKNDFISPRPGFTRAQYRSLAVLYLVASTRSGRWLVPGFHSTVDEGIADKHDGPQPFDLHRVDGALATIMREIGP